MSNAEGVPFEIQRANFFAVAWAASGLLFVGLAGAPLVDSGSFGIPYAPNAAAGLETFAIAGYYHFRPDSMDNGSDPAPRTWFEVAGLVIALGIFAIIVEVLLFSVL